MGFGMLRVFNDDVIAPGTGFGMHHHKDFEIITIVMKGVVSHKDDMGNKMEVRAGEVQVMSAGTGVTHAEFNDSKNETLELFQIWIEPNTKGVESRYAQANFSSGPRHNAWQIYVSGGDVPDSLMIHQDARISRADIDAGKNLSYTFSQKGNGAYCFVIDGEVEVGNETLRLRDALGIWDTDHFSITAKTFASVLLIEVPMG